MYIFYNQPEPGHESEWLASSLQIGDCFDILLRNKDSCCEEAYETLARFGILICDSDRYLLVHFDTEKPWTAGALAAFGTDPLLQEIHTIFGKDMQTHMFTASGSLYALLCFTNEPEPAELRAVLEQRCRALLSYAGKRLRHIALSQLEHGRQGIFHMANSLRSCVDYLRFFSDAPQFCFPELTKQTSPESMQIFDAQRQLAASIAEGLTDRCFDASAAAASVLRQLRADSACSIETLHMHLQTFITLFTGQLVSNTIVDNRFLTENDIAYRMMQGDTDRLLTESMENMLRTLHVHCIALSERFNTEYLRQVHNYVEQNIASQELSVSGIAEHFHANRSQLTAQFRDYYGLSLLGFINSSRVERACILIRSHRTWPLEEVAAAAGYCSLSTMYRAFQKSGLCSPAQFRRDLQAGM